MDETLKATIREQLGFLIADSQSANNAMRKEDTELVVKLMIACIESAHTVIRLAERNN